MADMFGAPVGDQEAIRSMGMLAQTQGQQIQNAQQAEALRQQQGMAQLMQGLGSKPGESLTDRLEEASLAAVKAGFVDQGSKLATSSAELRLKQAQATHAQAQTLNQQITAAKTQLNIAEQLLGGVQDPESWRTANTLYEQMTGVKSPFGDIPYSPALIDRLRRETLTYKDQLDLQIKQQQADARSASVASANSFRDFRKGILQQEADVRAAHEARLAKATGRVADAGSPTKSELDAAVDHLQGSYPDLPSDEAVAASYAVAARARVIRKTTPGLDADEALDRAMQDLNKKGQLTLLNDNYKIMGVPIPGTSRQRAGFSKAGTSPATPLTQVPPDASARKKGAYYSIPGKGTFQWKGNGWAPAESPAAAGTEDEDEDGEDE